MKLLTQALLQRFAQIGRQEEDPDPLVICKLFTPDSSWTWFATEYDPDTRNFFGYVIGFEKEWGYFNLDEMESARGPLGLPIERDLYFPECRLSALKEKLGL